MGLYGIQHVQLYANINGVIVDVTSFECVYAINAIPVAIVNVPLGTRDVMIAPGVVQKTVSNAHVVMEAINFRLPIEIYHVSLYGAGGDKLAFCPGHGNPYIIFAGYITGASFIRSGTQFTAQLRVTHWLSNLADSSVFIKDLTQLGSGTGLSPVNLTSDKEGKQQNNDWVTHTAAHEFFTPAGLRTDLWEACIKPWLMFLMRNSRTGAQYFIDGVNDNIDSAALTSLSLIYSGGLPFVMADVEDDESYAKSFASYVANKICNVSDRETADKILQSNTNIWGSLVSLGAELGFMIVPLPTYAFVVPYCLSFGGYLDVWGRGLTLTAHEIVEFSAESKLSQLLRAVMLVAEKASSADVKDTVGMVEVVGGFEGLQYGAVKYYRAPAFIGKAIAPGQFTHDGLAITEWPAVSRGKHGTAQKPAEGDPPRKKHPARSRVDLVGMLSRYAGYLYGLELFSGRTGMLAGPLRYDIAPGSTILIQTIERPNLTRKPYIAFVNRVHIKVDAAGAIAVTALQLEALRSASEQEFVNMMGINYNPLYNAYWYGFTLIDPALFY